ncbi:contact-dependent growth inhibition system immunity protein [Pseudomonas sp. MWU15-20650]|uniref:contact-dependent growth inhibition system immunity protein n=1 Tax=Pseudomonas sp. MWU15-20650 TaxID=2933107 RepID=UPI00200F2A53|nr:contact-dependent growth inhibition system immunity protein [Pseudomonas sp. MWU15-20650]
MNTPLTELQQFFGAYFNQDWAEDYSSADEVIDSFLQDSSSDVIIIVRNEILELINSYTDEADLQENLLHIQYCHYYYPCQWASGPLWLNHIVGKFDNHLLKIKIPT